ncbi:protein ABHD8 [Serinus canaria]|uniref:protein ABHD8 n=2 Tax=Passeroidea TaxID=175121 RepID=UPI0021CCAAB8|nr:protein ABHD8 [Serinus canaria]
MEKSSFAMAKFGLEHKEAMPKRDCGFYVKYIFLFTSLIQFLIILGLVLFMVYGNAQAGTDTHLRLLEEQVKSHYHKVTVLSAANSNLSRVLNATLKDRDKAQGVALKAQRELEKCNSSQASSSIPQLRELLFRQVRLTECQVITALINNTCTAEKLQLQRQLDQASLSKKTLEEKGRESQAKLGEAKQEGDKCQQELQSARTEGRLSRMELEVHKQRCSSLQSDVSEKILRVLDLAKQYQCKEAEKELGQIRVSVEELLRRQKERDSHFVWRSSCELSVQQCRHNCSREVQELQQSMQGLEKRQRDGEEERKRLQAEKEKVGKELEEQRKAAAAMEESLRQQLGVCVGTKVGTWGHGTGDMGHGAWDMGHEFFSKLGYEVVAPDLAGHGCSSAPPVAAAYTFYALAEDMRAVFKRYAKKRNILIGHSYGVSFCTFLAHEYPELVHKVIMINGGGPTALEPSLCSIFNLPPCVLHCLSPCLAWSFLKAGFARQGAKEKQLLKEGNAFNVSSFVLRATMSGQYWPEGDELYHAELAVPVLLVHGMHDKFVPIEEDQRMAEILLIAFLKVIDEGSHMVMLECPDTVNTLLHEFVLWEPDTPAARGDGDTK